jgi:hypothetical protein
MFKELLKRPVAGILMAAGVMVLAPVVLLALARAARPLAKAVLHGYYDLVDEIKALAADEENKSTPVIEQLVTTGVTEAATAAGEGALEEGVTDAIVEGVVTALEVV